MNRGIARRTTFESREDARLLRMSGGLTTHEIAERSNVSMVSTATACRRVRAHGDALEADADYADTAAAILTIALRRDDADF